MKSKEKKEWIFGELITALRIALLAGVTGCVGYVDGGYGGAVVVPAPDLYFYGGSYERGREVRDYSHRGFESRAVAHPADRRQEGRPALTRPGPYSPAHSGGGEPDRRQ
jgi:hypothetical protein